MYDLIIVGAGPAGATLARLLGQTHRILVIDKRTLQESHHSAGFEKCCGGLIAPDAQAMLARFGLGIPQEVLVGPQLFSVRTMDLTNDLERYYQRHYINVNRERFDRWLVSLIPSHVELVFDCVLLDFEVIPDSCIQVRYIHQGTIQTVVSKALVGADGAFSSVRKKLGGDEENHAMAKMYVAIQEQYPLMQSMPYYSAIFDESITDFYSWMIPKDDVLLLGAALLPNNQPYQKFLALKQKLMERGFEFGPCLKKHGSYLARPEKQNQIFLGKESVMLVGEAAGWISPSSAEGLSYAFRSALALAQAMNADSHFVMNQYEKKTRALRWNIFLKHCKSPFMYHKHLRGLVMHSNLMAMDVLDDPLKQWI